MTQKVQAKTKTTTKLDIIHIRSFCVQDAPASDLVLRSEGGPGHSLSSSRSGPRKAKSAHWAESSNPDRRTQDSDVRDRWKSTSLRVGGALRGMDGRRTTAQQAGHPSSSLGLSFFLHQAKVTAGKRLHVLRELKPPDSILPSPLSRLGFREFQASPAHS